MGMFKHLTNADKKKIKNAVEKELARYQLHENLLTNSEDDSVCINHPRIKQAIERLPTIERFLVEQRYVSVNNEYLTDNQVFNFKFDPPISAATYATIRNRAMIKLALFLDLDTGVELNI